MFRSVRPASAPSQPQFLENLASASAPAGGARSLWLRVGLMIAVVIGSSSAVHGQTAEPRNQQAQIVPAGEPGASTNKPGLGAAPDPDAVALRAQTLERLKALGDPAAPAGQLARRAPPEWSGQRRCRPDHAG
jgi:hypothetical protein